MLIREPELGYNTENKRNPGRVRAEYMSYGKREAKDEERKALDEVMIEENTKAPLHSKAWWTNLFNGFAMNLRTDPVSSDLALFLYCMLN